MKRTSQRDLLAESLLCPAALDAQYRARGFDTLAGVDEAGRGPLAGPVVAAAVILPTNVVLRDVTDSKLLLPEDRNRLYKAIIREAMSVSIGVVESTEIDRINILQASLAAMKKAVGDLAVSPEALLIDGPMGIGDQLPQFPLVRGDRRSQVIAAASIIAKVTRDQIMLGYHDAYPQYAFDRNKGYGTWEHLMALRKHGCCPIHRKTFRGVVSPQEMKAVPRFCEDSPER